MSSEGCAAVVDSSAVAAEAESAAAAGAAEELSLSPWSSSSEVGREIERRKQVREGCSECLFECFEIVVYRID